jgi:hypothetical protein
MGKPTECGKVCLSERTARAHVLARDCYSRAYQCPCGHWHTTSQPLAGQPALAHYRTPVKHTRHELRQPSSRHRSYRP